MGLLARAFSPRAQSTWSPMDDRWYSHDLGITSDAGLAVNADTIMMCDTVVAALRFKAESVAVCTPKVFRSVGPDREPAPDHPVQHLLRDPNAAIIGPTGFEWTKLNVLTMSSWGNSYNRLSKKRYSSPYFVDDLEWLHPSLVQMRRRSDGGIVYTYRPQIGGPQEIQEEDMLHYRDLSTDGMRGLAMYQLIRNIVGVSLAIEKHTAAFLRRGTRLSGILTTQLDMTEEVRNRAVASWNAKFGSVNSDQVGGVALLGAGLTFTPMSVDHQKSQLVQLDSGYVEKILRALGVPGVVVGYQGDKASTYASAEAFFEKGGIKHCILPTIRNIEERDDKVLLPVGSGYFTKRDLAVLERANTKDTFAMLVSAAGRPIITGNEARAKLDLNRVEDPSMDRVVLQLNSTTRDGDAPDKAEAPARSKPAPPPPGDDEEEEDASAERARWRAVALAAAGTIARREVAAIRGTHGAKGAWARYAADPAGWRAWVAEQYDRHAPVVSRALGLSDAAARAYCDGQVAALLAPGGLAAVETWEETIPPRLAGIALGGAC